VTVYKLNPGQSLLWTAILIWLFFPVLVTNAEESLSISLTSDPPSPTKEIGAEFRVIINYNLIHINSTDNVQVFYWIPDGLRHKESTPEGTSDPDNDKPRLRWDIQQDPSNPSPASIVITLEIIDLAQLDQQSQHRAAISAGEVKSEDRLLVSWTDLTLAEPTATVEALSTEVRPDLQIIAMDSSSNVVRPGQNITVTVTLKNEGVVEASDIRLLPGTPQLSFAHADAPILLDTLAPGREFIYLIPIQAKDVPDGSYVVFAELLLGEDPTPIASKEIEVQIEQPKQPDYTALNQSVSLTEDGLAKLTFEFRNNGGAEGAVQLVLRYESNSLEVVASQLNGQTLAGAEQMDRGGYAWRLEQPGDWRSPEPIVLEVDVRVKSNPGAVIGFTFSDRQNQAQYGGPFRLTTEEIRRLVSVIQAPGSKADERSVTGWLIGQRWPLIGSIILLVILVMLFVLTLRRRVKRSVVEQPAAIVGSAATDVSAPLFAAGAPYLKKKSDNRTFAIDSFPFTIGRDEKNILVINESFERWPTVSRHHCQITQHPQGYVIEDLGSQNKLRVQGRLTEKNLLRNGWVVIIGAEEFVFYDGVSDHQG
jgi:hypothetical protein